MISLPQDHAPRPALHPTEAKIIMDEDKKFLFSEDGTADVVTDPEIEDTDEDDEEDDDEDGEDDDSDDSDEKEEEEVA